MINIPTFTVVTPARATRFLTISLIVVLCSLFSGCSKPDYTDHFGDSGRFSDFNGKWMIINYWATWCKPCIEEIPELNQFARDHSDKVALFGVEYDQTQDEQLQKNIGKLGIEFPVIIHDPSALLGFKKPHALPTTFVFNPKGELHKILKGPQTEASLLDALN